MHKDEIVQLLPGVFQKTVSPSGENSGDLLMALLTVMEGLHKPVEDVLDNLDHYFHPDMASDRMLPYLANWVGLGPLLPANGAPFPFGNNRLRDLVWAAVSIAQLRGTRQGMRILLEAATGVAPFLIEADGKRPFHLIIQYPTAAEPYTSLIEQILDLEKPAYATYQLIRKENSTSSSNRPVSGELRSENSNGD